MVFVSKQSLCVVFLRLFEVFVRNVLMTTQGVSVSEILVELDRSAEELNSCFMLSLKTVAVAYYTPSLGCK